MIPVAVLTIIAPNNGVQPCFRRSLTKLFRRTKWTQKQVETTRKMQSTRGNGVLTKSISSVEIRPRRQRVMRSPKHEAIGGAMLSTL